MRRAWLHSLHGWYAAKCLWESKCHVPALSELCMIFVLRRTEQDAEALSRAVWRTVWPRERLQQRAFFNFGQEMLLTLDLQVAYSTLICHRMTLFSLLPLFCIEQARVVSLGSR